MTVEDARIHLRCWGDPTAPGLVLLHGGSAHSGWWDHIAPALTGTHRVVAPDFSGHGDSDRRAGYDTHQWAREVAAAAGAGGITSPYTVIGHSMGGLVAAIAAAHYGDRLDGIVMIDTPLRDHTDPERLRKSKQPPKSYPTREAILDRFTTRPPQEILSYVRAHVAAESIREIDGGWGWKYDMKIIGDRPRLRALLPNRRCRAAVLCSESGLVPPAMAEEISALLGPKAPVLRLPATGHHPMFDQPLAVIAALRTVLAYWSLLPGREVGGRGELPLGLEVRDACTQRVERAVEGL